MPRGGRSHSDIARGFVSEKSEGNANEEDSSLSLTQSDRDESENEVSEGYMQLGLVDEAASRITGLEQLMAELREKEATVVDKIDDFNLLWENRRRPLDEELAELRRQLREADGELQEQSRLRETLGAPPPPGPESLRWVDGLPFHVFCDVIVALNLIAMFLPSSIGHPEVIRALNNVFLAWYVVELSLKAAYFQGQLLVGKVSVVWWNWLDLLIVLSGVVDQWLLPLFLTGQHHVAVPKSLRSLRLLRLLRFLKFLKPLIMGDLQWTKSPKFEGFMAIVITMNVIVMGLEMDYESPVWLWLENFCLVVYFLELIARLKSQQCSFFYDCSTLMWNYADTVMVLSGALELWLLPMISLLQRLISGSNTSHQSKAGREFLQLLMLLRTFRLLRLVKLLRVIEPLYRLMLGVVESIKAMQWVMVLTFVILYAFALFWTTLVGKGFLFGESADEIPPETMEHFGTVSRSYFSLFRIMNGDVTPVHGLTHTMLGQLLFAGFMITTNWAILAILTSVVSDNMIESSNKTIKENEEATEAQEQKVRRRRLLAVFHEFDRENQGFITEQDWQDICGDPGLMGELCDITHLPKVDFQEYFMDCAACHNMQHGTAETSVNKGSTLHYDMFVEHVNCKSQTADQRSVLQLLARMAHMEESLKSHLAHRE